MDYEQPKDAEIATKGSEITPQTTSHNIDKDTTISQNDKWGEEGIGKSDGYGLSKLIKYHPEVVDNLQEILDDIHIVSRSENRIKLESDTHQASVRLTWDN